MKNLIWWNSAKRDLAQMPAEVQDAFGYALYLAQVGKKHEHVKPLKGFGGASVLEVVEAFDGDAYRAVYTVAIADAIYVLHCFQKKSKSGKSTPLPDIELIRARLQAALKHAGATP